MGGKSSPPPPDYTPLAQSSRESAEIMAALGRQQMAESTALGREQIAAARELAQQQMGLSRDLGQQQIDLSRQLGQGQLDFATRQYEEMFPIVERSAQQQMAAQEEQMRQARDYYDYMTGTFRPVEQDLVARAREFDVERFAGLAAEEAARAFGATQDQTARGLARMGVSPNSGAAQAQMNQNALALASQRAGATTAARERGEQLGYARMLDVAGLGRNLPGASTAAYAGASGAGAAGQQGIMAPGQAYMSNMGAGVNTILGGMGAGTGTMLGGLGAGAGTLMGGLGAGAGTILSGGAAGAGLVGSGLNMQQSGLSSILGTQGSVYGASMNQSDPIMGLIGTGIGAYAALSDRRLKQDIELVGRDERTGLSLYEYAYKSDPSRRFIGVMADEVEAYMPEAVGESEDGYKFVNYGMLGIEMMEV